MKNQVPACSYKHTHVSPLMWQPWNSAAVRGWSYRRLGAVDSPVVLFGSLLKYVLGSTSSPMIGNMNTCPYDCCSLCHLGPKWRVVNNPPVNAGDAGVKVLSLGQGDALKEEMATHSSILAWKIPWREESGGLQSMGSHRVRHD